MPPAINGTTTRRIVLMRVAPNDCAASSSDTLICCKDATQDRSAYGKRLTEYAIMMMIHDEVSSVPVPGSSIPRNVRKKPMASTMPGIARAAEAMKSSHWRAGSRVRSIR
ncbi:hypothetical protein D3C87_1503200 [compost metagenome]